MCGPEQGAEDQCTVTDRLVARDIDLAVDAAGRTDALLGHLACAASLPIMA